MTLVPAIITLLVLVPISFFLFGFNILHIQNLFFQSLMSPYWATWHDYIGPQSLKQKFLNLEGLDKNKKYSD